MPEHRRRRLTRWQLIAGLSVGLLIFAALSSAVSTTASAVTAPTFTLSAAVVPTSVVRGRSVSITAAVTSATATSALVDIEVYSPSGAKAYQTWFDNQSFAAGQLRTYPVSWQLPASAAEGVYTVNLLVFAPGWTKVYSSISPAATFSVFTAPTFTLSAAVVPTSVVPGGSVGISAAVTSATATSALVDIEVYSPSGAKAYQTWFDNQSFAAGQLRTYPVSWQLPASAAEGVYTVNLLVFAPGWTKVYSSISPAATFSVFTAPTFTLSAAVVPTSVVPGGSVGISAAVTSATATSALVDIEVYSPSGAKAYQTWFDNQSFAAGQLRTYPVSWQLPASAAEGVYTVNLLVFAPGWTKAYSSMSPAATFSVTAPAPAPTTGFSPLHVQGNQLANAAGQSVTRRGVNGMGREYMCPGGSVFDGRVDAASIAAIKSWNTNAVRVPLNEDCWLGINGFPASSSGANYQDAIKAWVTALNNAELYVILDLHWNAPGTQQSRGQQLMADLDHAPSFWTSVANAFKGNDTVIFELYNEPHLGSTGPTTADWTCLRDGGTCAGVTYQVAGMQAMLNAVRATGATNVAAIAGMAWSNNLTRWMEFKPNDPLNNLVAVWHIYSFQSCDTVPCYGNTISSLMQQVPLIATELGSDSCDAQFMAEVMNFLDARRGSYLAWTWTARLANACTSIKLIYDYYTGAPTQYGQLYRDHILPLSFN